MTVLNFVQSDDHEAVLLMDTRHSGGGYTSKMLPVPHLGAIVAGVGRLLVLYQSAARLALTCDSFDTALSRAEEIFRLAVAEVNALDTAHGMDAVRAQTAYGGGRWSDHLAIVGWSDRHGYLRSCMLAAAANDGEISITHDMAVWANIGHPVAIEELEKGVPSDDAALGLVRTQIEFIRQKYPCRAEQGLPELGGRLLRGRVTRGEVSVRDLGAL